MNAAVTDDPVETSLPAGPGARLKALREAQDLELSRIASLLHLSEEKLAALEADDYERLPGPVFVQGYLRNYGRLIGVPVEPLIKAFHESTGLQGRQPDLRLTQVRHEVRSSHLLVRLMTWGIIIGLIALVVIWWRGYLQWPVVSQMTPPAGDTVSSETSELASDPQVEDSSLSFTPTPYSEIDDSGQASLALPGQAPPEAEALPVAAGSPPEAAPDTPFVESMPSPAGGLPLPSAPAVDPLPLPSSSPPVPLVDTPSIIEENQPVVTAAAPAGPGIRVRFLGNSWVEIRDASGTFNVVGEIEAGSERLLGGTPPYRVVLGNASAVQILIDGEPFDLTPYQRGDVARFSLEP